MSRQTYSVEQIIIKLRQIEVQCGQGKTVAEAARQAGITEQTYYRWRKQWGHEHRGSEAAEGTGEGECTA